jgi:hypothetical protein
MYSTAEATIPDKGPPGRFGFSIDMFQPHYRIHQRGVAPAGRQFLARSVQMGSKPPSAPSRLLKKYPALAFENGFVALVIGELYLDRAVESRIEVNFGVG